MFTIISPKHPVDNPYRDVEREEILASAFYGFMQEVVSAGWQEPEAALTLADIADDYIITLAKRFA